MADPPVVSVELHPAEHVRVDAADWERRVQETRSELEEDGLDANDLLATALKDIRFTDAAGTLWGYDGHRWWRRVAGDWENATPQSLLHPQPVTMEMAVPPEPDALDALVPRGEVDGELDGEPGPYVATDLIPLDGLDAWLEPDGNVAPAAMLDGGLDVMVVDYLEDGWAQVRCSNGWVAWVDGRLLIPLGDD